MSETEAPAKKETEVETVTMDDGRVVEFVGKKMLVKESGYDAETKTLWCRLDFRHGETRTFRTGDIQLILKFAAHGAEQKFGDEVSGVKDDEDKVEAIDTLMQRLEKGVSGWLIGKEAGQGMAGASVLARALVRYSKQDIRTVRDYLATLDAKTKTALRADPEVAQHIKDIEAERAARAAERGKSAKPGVDTSSILAGLRAASEAQPA